MIAKTYRQAMEAFDRWLVSNGGDLNGITRYDVQSYIKSLEANGKSATTINKVFTVISVFARFIKRQEVT